MSLQAAVSFALAAAALCATAAPVLAEFPYTRGAQTALRGLLPRSGRRPRRPQRQRDLDVLGHAGGHGAARPRSGSSSATCAAATSSTPTPGRRPPGRPRPGGPTSRSPSSTPGSSGTTTARWRTCASRPGSTRASSPTPTPGGTTPAARPSRCSAATAPDSRRAPTTPTATRSSTSATSPATTASPINAANNVNPDLFEPQDVLIAFTGGAFAGDDDSNGFDDDIVGWDFLDDDNDPYDDVQYGHGTGEANDSTAEADNGQGGAGACPNCVFDAHAGRRQLRRRRQPLRAGDASTATDNGALVIQEALGTLNNSRLARESVDYAYEHGTTVIASAADEAAQHNNWPSSLPHVILVNSVDEVRRHLHAELALLPAVQRLHQLQREDHRRDPLGELLLGRDRSRLGHRGPDLQRGAERLRPRQARAGRSDCERTVDLDGDPGLDPCLITPNEVRQLMASGTIDGTTQVGRRRLPDRRRALTCVDRRPCPAAPTPTRPPTSRSSRPSAPSSPRWSRAAPTRPAAATTSSTATGA